MREYAIAYIDGVLYKGDTHANIVRDYIDTNYPEYSYLDDDEIFQCSLNPTMFMGSVLKGIDNNQYIVFYKDGSNTSVKEILNIIKTDYPNSILCTVPYERNNKPNKECTLSILK